MNPAILDMDWDIYHADPCPEPSLSASIAKTIWSKSPAHAWMQHPRNPARKEAGRADFDFGHAVHAVALENDRSRFEIIDADNFRTKAAQEARDAARADGRVPLLRKEMDHVEAVADAVITSLQASPIAGAFADGKPEQTIIVKDNELWLRGRLDWLSNDHRTIIDLKTTKTSASPHEFERQIFRMGYDIQAAMYLRLVSLVTGVIPDFYFVPVEVDEPYATSIIGAGETLLEAGERKLEICMKKWRECMRAGEFAGYGTDVYWADAPLWAMTQVEEREIDEQGNALDIPF